jgi:glutamate--cysteine ligase
LLATESNRHLMREGLRGIERETLRVDGRGQLSLRAHPHALGAALTHPYITTDYSESLLEFITPAEPDISAALEKLDAIHRHAYTQLGDELLWSQSMPCALPEEQEIPIAWYGHSHTGMLKHVYRKGLSLRYGRTMQCIAGIHYNFSVADGVWQVLQQAEAAVGSAMYFQSEGYIALIRNFHRYSWLLMYLFGASPALSTQFLRGRPHGLQTFSADTLYLPFATSLRMSDLGYQNKVQAELLPPYNSLHGYMTGLSQAVRQPYAPYAQLGVNSNGEWMQINANVLQIENEYYATIRPKRVTRSGERPLDALAARGVQYVEARCLDVDPFVPCGISLQTSRFLDVFLHFCAFDASPLSDHDETRRNGENFARAVGQGRQPGLLLERSGGPISLQDWGLELLDRFAAVAELLDADGGGSDHANALALQAAKLRQPDLTPSAIVLQALGEHGHSFAEFSLRQSEAHAAHFRSRGVGDDERRYFATLAHASHARQQAIEQDQVGDFDQFISNYQA